jgi:hypothetical protein
VGIRIIKQGDVAVTPEELNHYIELYEKACGRTAALMPSLEEFIIRDRTAGLQYGDREGSGG